MSDTPASTHASPPSKSQRKRDARSAQALGACLVALPGHRLKALPLDGELLEAVMMARTLRPGGAHKRQIQFIGRLLRHMDTEPIRQALEQAPPRRSREPTDASSIHRLVAGLLSGGDEALHRLCVTQPGLDRQKLRRLVRRAVHARDPEPAPDAAGGDGARQDLVRYLSGFDVD
jgi:ribosome-associated protein